MCWHRCVPTTIYTEPAVSVVATRDGGVAVLAGDPLYHHPEMSLIRFTSSGDTLWTQRFGSPSSYMVGALHATEDGGFIVGAGLNLSDAYVAKVAENGSVEWESTFGNPQSSTTEKVNFIDVAANGDYLVVGKSCRSDGLFNGDPIAARLSPAGDTLWTRIYTDYFDGEFNAVNELSDGDLIFAGSTYLVGAGRDYDLLVLACDALGVQNWSAVYGGANSEYCYAACFTPDHGLIMAGFSHPHLINAYEILVLRTGSVLTAARPRESVIAGAYALTAYPNPFNNQTIIRFELPSFGDVNLSVFNVSGRLVTQRALGFYGPGTHEFFFDGVSLPSGFYFCEVNMSGVSLTSKLLLLR